MEFRFIRCTGAFRLDRVDRNAGYLSDELSHAQTSEHGTRRMDTKEESRMESAFLSHQVTATEVDLV